MTLSPTPLELELLGLFYRLHGHIGFPEPSQISVVSRKHTGGGRYVDLVSTAKVSMPDGHYDMGGQFIEMQGIPNGMMAVARVVQGAPVEIEIAVYGGYSWDGSEAPWYFK